MKNLLCYLFLLVPFALLANPPYEHEFKTTPNDPYNVLTYELENGLKIYLSVNKDEPKISTNIAVRTGSKNDPEHVTGLAHYLEHMLFKGTSKIGSLDWEAEKVYLQQISDNYEVLRKTENPEERKVIYRAIDSLSHIASGYVATNEYDQMVKELGASGTNAYTSFERTVYINTIPTNEIEKWMMIESERFNELVLRLFHTEIEAVYEEFNRSQDSDGRAVFYEMFQTLFPTHHYGTQTTIGTAEHLKNPSMEEIHNYFKTYYVPNNMAIIMTGNLDPDKMVNLIEQYFGSMKKGPEAPQYENPVEKPINEPIEKTVYGTEAAGISISYRTDGVNTEDELMAELASMVLYNGEAGLIDQNINQPQKLLESYAYSYGLLDYGTFSLGATPREGQSLQEARDLLLEQVQLLKEGVFEESLLKAITKNARKAQMRQAESNSYKARLVIDAFIFEKPWSYYSEYFDRLEDVSKEELVAWANENLQNNYVVVLKEVGEREPIRLEKPEITPIQINRGQKSEFRTAWEKNESEILEPHFINFETDLKRTNVAKNMELFHVPNKTNELFSLYYIFDMGSRNDKELALALEYLPYLGTDKYSAKEIKRKFYDLALDYNVSAGEDRLYISLNGLSETMDEGMQLFEELLANVKADPEAYTKMVDGILKERSDDKLNKNKILYSALWNYALYEDNSSPTKDILSEEELHKINPDQLAKKIKEIDGFKHKIFYYGPQPINEIAELVIKNHPIEDEYKEYPPRSEYTYRDQNESKVYYVNYDQVQAELVLLSKVEKFSSDNMAAANVFNQYFGSGLSSIVFQEIRESKALAYSAYSVYTSPRRQDEFHFVRAYIGTQADKLNAATDAMLQLMTEMPREMSNFNQARTGALKQMAANPITKSQIFWAYQSNMDRGLSTNPQVKQYQSIQEMDIDVLEDFFENKIKGRNYAYLVIGKKDQMDFEALAKLGEVQEVTLEEIFGY